MKKIFTLLSLFAFALTPVFSQLNTNFNVSLQLNFTSIDQTIALFEDQPISTQMMAEARGNVIAASTEGMIADRRAGFSLLRDYFDSLKYHQWIREDIYHLEEGRKNVTAIKELLNAIKIENFSTKVSATVEQIFPEDARVNVALPVYVVAFGHENVDAFVRRIVWHGDVPEFVGENAGELTIVINLSHAVNYGPSLQERFVSLLGVVAHEVFHAAFGAYKETLPAWKSFYAYHTSYFDNLLDLTQNEGIAYYLSLEQRWHGRVPSDWYERTRDVFGAFNKNSLELLSSTITPRHASKILRDANLNGFWESYGCSTGMFIAREIDQRMGRAALIETIANGPLDFFRKYIDLTTKDSNLPPLSEKIATQITRQ
jgi:hypothetical protein